jgi:hypothetical protein
VACITVRSVISNDPVFRVTHYEDDHSWAFLDGREHREAEALVVATGSLAGRHPQLDAIADLAPALLPIAPRWDSPCRGGETSWEPGDR